MPLPYTCWLKAMRAPCSWEIAVVPSELNYTTPFMEKFSMKLGNMASLWNPQTNLHGSTATPKVHWHLPKQLMHCLLFNQHWRLSCKTVDCITGVCVLIPVSAKLYTCITGVCVCWLCIFGLTVSTSISSIAQFMLFTHRYVVSGRHYEALKIHYT